SCACSSLRLCSTPAAAPPPGAALPAPAGGAAGAARLGACCARAAGDAARKAAIAQAMIRAQTEGATAIVRPMLEELGKRRQHPKVPGSSDRRQQGGGDATVLGEEHIVCATSGAGFHRLDRDTMCLERGAQRSGDGRHMAAEPEK